MTEPSTEELLETLKVAVGYLGGPQADGDRIYEASHAALSLLKTRIGEMEKRLDRSLVRLAQVTREFYPAGRKG